MRTLRGHAGQTLCKTHLDKDVAVCTELNRIADRRYLCNDCSMNQPGTRDNAENEISLKERMDFLKEFTSAAFSKATAYSNVVIVAGYVAYFSIWNFTRPFLTKKWSLLSALFVSLSGICFVGFEIYKMIAHQLYLERLAKSLSSEKLTTAERIKAYTVAESEFSMRFMKTWRWSLYPTLAFALIGVSILLCNLIKGLLSSP